LHGYPINSVLDLQHQIQQEIITNDVSALKKKKTVSEYGGIRHHKIIGVQIAAMKLKQPNLG